MSHSPNEALSLPVKDTYYLVKFAWSTGSTQTQTWTDWGSDVVHTDGLTYTAEPSMRVSLPANDGTLKAAPCTITLPMPDPPDSTDLRERVIETKHQPVTVTVTEIMRGESGGEQARVGIVFRGRLGRARRNLGGVNGQLRMDFFTPKSQLEIRTGLQCNHQCVNTLYGPLCKADPSATQDFGTLTAINGAEVTITGLASKTGRFWDRGWLIIETLHIPIRDWVDTDPTKFKLVRRPPSHWLNKTVQVLAGCDKTIETCRSRFVAPGGAPGGTTGNESHFNGIGYGIPAYNPVIETPS